MYKKISSLFLALLLLEIGAANAQYTILHNFNVTAGEYPSGTLTLSGKILYGTTLFGGKNDSGCVFSMDTSGNNFKDIYDFGGAGNGAFPFGGSLKLAGNRLYGMTQAGGVNDSGCVYSIDTNGTGYRDLFDFNGTNGSNPLGSVTLSGKKLFGMTYGGGADHLGVIFTLDTLGHNYKLLYAFSDGYAGANPYGDVTAIGYKLFGMSSAGLNEDGNIFSIDSNGTDYVDLYDFSGAQPDYPNNILTPLGNKFFGMTYGGGAANDGNIFSIDTNGGGYNEFLDFSGMGSSGNGAFPIADVVFSNGFLYGTTSNGGVNDSGTVFKVDTNGAIYVDLYDFEGPANGSIPQGDLVVAGGTLYGTAQSGGSSDAGVVFKINSIAAAGIKNIKDQASVKLYPDPSNGVFNISIINQQAGSRAIEIYNILGEQVYNTKISTAQFSINLSNQPNGIYLYKVIAEDGNLMGHGKLIIQK